MASPLSDHVIEGAALASLELHKTLVTALVAGGIIPRAIALELIDQTIARVEKMQLSQIPSLEGPAQAARFHIEALLAGVRALPPRQERTS